MQKKPKLSIIIVHYKDVRALKRCLRSVCRKVRGIQYEVLVVSNSSDDITFVEKDFGADKVFYIQNKRNIGFGAACNVGARRASGEVLFFLNPDCEITNHQTNYVVKFLLEDSKRGIVGAALFERTGNQERWSVGWEPNVFHIILNNFFSNILSRHWLSKKKLQVDWVSGAAFFIRREDFLVFNGFDERFFLYFEDVDLCRRIRKVGRSIWRYPFLHVRHGGGTSFSQISSHEPLLQKQYYYDSQDKYIRKHYGEVSQTLLSLLRSLHNKKD